MAADTVVSLVLEKLRQLLLKEASLLVGLRGAVKSFCDKLEMMQPFLRDCGRVSQEDESVKLFLNKIRDLAYEAENTINRFVITKFRRYRIKVLSQSEVAITKSGVLRRINDIMKRMDEIYATKDKLGIVINMASNQASEEDVVGLKDELDTLLKRMFEGDQPAERTVISIVGMGGLGKTTLAQKIYNHPIIKYEFESRAWVTVSQKYKLNELLQSLIKQFTRITEAMEMMNEHDLGMVLYNHLTDTKYLIVMDDVWKRKVWRDLNSFFPNQGNGSRILITTRNNQVAVQANTDQPKCPPHHLRFLDEEESWDLFRNKAFQGKNCSLEWVEVGRQIAHKCGGLPLAIVGLGDLLSRQEPNLNEWRRFTQHVSTYLAYESDPCKDKLALSYDALPYYLKLCFLYFGMFPKDHEIPARQLIQLWIAEGFIQEKDGEMMEDTAETCLEKLVDRSLIQVASRRSDYGVKTCRIHVLLHDLCIYEAQKECFFYQIHGHEINSPPPTNPIRLAGSYGSLVDIISNPHVVARVHSLLCFTQSSDASSDSKSYASLNFQKRLPLLRVLGMEDSGCKPKDMTRLRRLVHLRYLGVRSKTTTVRIPHSIYKCWNLQTLDLRSGYVPHAQDAPGSIWKMKNLRHAYFHGQTLLRKLPRSLSSKNDDDSSLKYLQTLSTICPSNCTRQVFSKLPNLLKLGVCGDLESYIYALLDNLVILMRLQSLKLVRHHSFKPLTRIPNQFPPMLTKLTLRDTALHEDPMPVLGNLPKLQILKLVGDTYNGFQMVCSSTGFQQLQFLKIVRSKVRELIIEKGAMPNVNHLVVRDCDHLYTFDEEDLRLSAVKNAIEQWQEITAARVEEQVEEQVEEKEIKDESIRYISVHGFPFIKMDRNRLDGEMADTGVFSFLLEDLSQLLLKEADLVRGVMNEVQSLCDQLKLMHPILRECEQVYQEDEKAKMFLSNIRDLAFEAQDTIYTYVSAQDSSSRGDFVNMTKKHEVPKKIKNIKERMKEIFSTKDKFAIGIKKASEASKERPSHRKACVIEEEDIVGFKDEANTLVERLIGGKSERDVISIVGMSGLGKTTLAKKIYNHESIQNGFQYRAWVTVSQEYKPKELLQNLIEQFIRITEDMETMSEEQLGKVLKNCLTGGKYFIVMDDVWIPQIWLDLNSFFPNQGNGSSRIMITTRNNEVAIQANPVPNFPPHYLRYLDKEESWELFRNKAFRGENCSPQWVNLGRQMSGKCGGLPLAIVALGSLISEKEPDFNKWRKVTKHVGKFLAEHPNLCKNALVLSYDALPNYLKPCFLYFGMFPKDHEIPARQLIQMWIAEGFIQVTGRETLEDTAETYLEKLINQSLIQVASRRSDYGVKTCRIHVLLHYLCIAQGQKERFFQIDGPEIHYPSPTNPVRLAGNYESFVHIICNPYVVAKVHSFLCFTEKSDTLGSGGNDKYNFNDIYKKFPFLRVMRIESSSTAGNALCGEMMGKLIYLRYFRMSSEISLKKIPPSICDAWNLQTLDIRSRCLPNAPDEIWNMKKLRHIHFQGQTRLPQPSNDDDSTLEYLQTLSTICPSSCSSQVFSKLPNLLKLGVCGDLKPHMEALFNNLSILKNLQVLKLIRKTLSFKPPTRILSGLPPSLTKITICDTSLRQDPMPVLGKLPNLQILKLVGDAYYGSWLICSPQGFPQLQLLHIVRSNVRYLIINEGAMKRLNRLVVRDCPSLNLDKAMPQLTSQQLVVEHT